MIRVFSEMWAFELNNGRFRTCVSRLKIGGKLGEKIGFLKLGRTINPVTCWSHDRIWSPIPHL